MIKVDIKKDIGFELDIAFSLKQGDFLALSGVSGSGKTTLLRVIAGLERASGVVEVFGKIWQDKTNFLPPQKREIGFVFQDYALFTNMSVEQNLLFVKNDKTLANRLLELIGLFALKGRYPNSLSGGQQQRVALARALMKRPKILLLDEPLSALDFQMRNTLQEEIAKVHKEFNLTTILVSHNRAEILKLANKEIVIESGKIIKKTNLQENLKPSKTIKLRAQVVKLKGQKALCLVENSLIEIDAKSLKIGDFVELDFRVASDSR